MNIETKFNIKQKVKFKLEHRYNVWGKDAEEFISNDKYHTGKIINIFVEVGTTKNSTEIEYVVEFNPTDEDFCETYTEHQLEAV
jgi:hypothetical protein